MTVRDVYEATLIEINKENAQSFTTEEFNYIVNKAVLALVNEKYNFFATNQQLSDDLRVLIKNQTFNIDDQDVSIDPNLGSFFNLTSGYVIETSSTSVPITLSSVRDIEVNSTVRFGNSINEYNVDTISADSNEITVSGSPNISLAKNTYVKVETPLVTIDSDLTTARTVDTTFISSDYLHLISCRVLWKTKRPRQNTIAHLVFPGKRLTYDMLNAIQNNAYLKPAPNRPYYQIFDNINNSGGTVFPTELRDYKGYQNKPLLKAHIGSASPYMQLIQIEYDYLKIPEPIEMYDEDIFAAGIDTSQVLELPDYLLNEVVKRCTIYLLEKTKDPRVQTQPAFNQEIPAIPMNIQMEASSKQRSPRQQEQQ